MEVFAVDDAIGHYEQARALLQEHKPLQTELAAAEVEHLYAQLGRAYTLQNAWEKAQEAYEELLAYARQKSLPALVSMTLNRLAVLALQQSNDKPKARAFLEEAWQDTSPTALPDVNPGSLVASLKLFDDMPYSGIEIASKRGVFMPLLSLLLLIEEFKLPQCYLDRANLQSE